MIRDNHLIDAIFNLSLTELRLIICATSSIKVDSNGIGVDDWVNVSLPNFCALFDIKVSGSSYKNIQAASKKLFDRVVVIPSPDWDLVKTRWIEAVRYKKSEGVVSLLFADFVKPYLFNLQQYTKYKIKDFAGLQSVYAVRLYEMILKWAIRGYRTETIDNLRYIFGVEDKYSSVANFKKRVLLPAVNQINANSPLKVKVEFTKTGRQYSHVTFKIIDAPTTRSKGKLSEDFINKNAKAGESRSEAQKRLLQMRKNIEDQRRQYA